jgi:hypothetical protein
MGQYYALNCSLRSENVWTALWSFGKWNLDSKSFFLLNNGKNLLAAGVGEMSLDYIPFIAFIAVIQ